MTLFLTIGAMWAQVTSLEGFSQDKCYTFATSGRGAWAVDAAGTLFSSTGDQKLTVDANDTKQQFAVLSADGADYYLYSVSAKKFVKADRTLVAGPADALAIADASSQGAGRVQFRFRDVNNSYINLGGSNQMSVDWWGTIDAGNAVLVSEAGDFNAAEALAMLSKSMYVVTYEFVYDGKVKYTQEAEVAEGDSYPAVSKQFPFGVSVSGSVPNGVVTGTETVQIELSVDFPFEYAESFDAAEKNWNWYYLMFHASNKNVLYYDGTGNVLDASKAVVDGNNEDAYTWAFVGNPFDGFKVVNRLAGATMQLNASAEGAVLGNAAHVFALSSSSHAENGFFMASVNGDKKDRFNKQNNKVVYWTGADAGSTFMVEPRPSEAERLAVAVAKAQALLEANVNNHAVAPALRQYSTAGYEAFAAAIQDENATSKSVEAAILEFEKSKNLPLFTIDSQKDYALGQSIYENEEGALKFKTTDAADKSMLWAFDMTATEVGLTDKVVVRNAATGKLFWGEDFISVIETEPAVEGDGVFMFKTKGTGNPVHAQASGSSIVRWSSADANAVGGASTWTFTYVGLTNNAAYDLTDLAAPFAEQAMAFAGLQENASLSALPAVYEKWAEAMGVVEPLYAKVNGGELVLKADVEAAMATMTEIQGVVTYYSETFVGKVAEANAAMDELNEESDEYVALLGAINVSTVTTVTELEAKAEIIAEVLEYLASLPEVDPNDYTSYIINADLATGDAWNTVGTKGIADGMVKVASESAFDFSQTITLPAGQYKMTAKAVYRYTGSEAEEFAAIEAGTETHLVKLYAETSSYTYEGDVMNRWEGASETNLAGDGVSEVNGMFVPNSSNAVLAWFNAGQYVNELVFNVQEEGTVKIGITRVGGIAGDYTNIGAWTLTRVGDAVADPDPNNYTSYIVNADLSTGDAWNTVGTKGIADGMVKVASESAFDFSQIITLPAGQYKVTAKAAYRYTGSEQDEYNAILAGTETHLVKLYAETASYKYEGDVQNRWEGASDTNLAGDGVSEVNGMFVPNSSNAVLAWFNAGQYVNELVFNVQEEGTVKIGITRVGGIAGDYTNIGAWTLRRLGEAEADPKEEEPETPVDPEEPGDEPEATVDLDVTNKVNKDGWVVENGSKNTVTIDNIVMVENFQDSSEATGVVLWQDVTGLENGKYTVELWANARVAWRESAAIDGQEELTYLVANNVEISMQVLLNPGLNNNATYVLDGVEVTDGTLHIEMNKKAAGSNWHTIQIKSLTLHATNEVIANIAKVDLKAALEAANAVSPKTDEFAAAIAAAQDVYDNSKDAEEVKAAVATLKEATKLAILMNATEENPVLTDFVVNGTFDAGTTGWKSTTGAQNQGTATNQQGAFTGAFFENWHPSNYTGKLYQVIENIPNGIYELSICAFTNNHDATAQFVYANGDKVALTTGAPTAYTVRTIVENNTIEIGFEQTAAVSNWCGIDNISLTYLGEATNEAVLNAAKEAFTAAYEEFGAALTACQAMMLKMSFSEVDDAAYQLNEQLATTTDVDALNALVERLNEATASLNEINEVYAAYDVFVQKFKDASEISEPLTTEAVELLEYNMYGGAGMQATSIEALEQAVQTIKADFITYVANAKLLGDNMFDVTCLITNAAVTSAEGWTNAEGRIINNTEYTGAPDKAAFDAGWWAGVIDIHQVLPTLPAGNYVLSAIARSASPDSYLYAKSGETEVKATLPQNGDQGGELGNGWANVSTETINVVEGESLTIGVYINNPGTNFAAADNFKLYYAGVPKVDVAEVALNETAIEFEELGVTFQLEATVTPVDATSPAVTWTSSDDAVATVDENGLVTAVAVGTATITATADGVSATCAVTVTNIYDLDETIEGEWEDVTYAAPGEWAIIDDAELLGLGAYWEHTGYTNYDNARGVMEFVAGENTSAYLKQDYCPIYTPGTYRLTGKAFHKGATNAVMYVQNNETLTVEIPAAAEGASYENAEEYFTTFSIEFEVTSVTQVNVGYSCDFTNAEDFLVVGGFKLEMKSSTSLRNIFMETIMACESLGYEIMQMEALHAKQQAVMANAMPIYEAMMSSQKVLKSDVEASIEEMEAVMAEINPVAEYYKGEFMDALYAAEEFKSTLDEASQAYADLEAAINEAKDVAAVTTVAELKAKVDALEELMRDIETGIDNIETETETVIYDLSGRRVEKMEKGIYIVNGKKVFKK